jgi:hypothetical protein
VVVAAWPVEAGWVGVDCDVLGTTGEGALVPAVVTAGSACGCVTAGAGLASTAGATVGSTLEGAVPAGVVALA